VLAEHEIPEYLSRLLVRLHTHYLYLVEQIAELESELSQSINVDDTAQRIMTIPGVGPITASLLSSQLGDGKQFHAAEILRLPQGSFPGSIALEENRLCWVSVSEVIKIYAGYWFSVPAHS